MFNALEKDTAICDYTYPEVGKEYYFIENEGTPFEGKRFYVTVLDIKDGYVKYKNKRIGEKTIFNNEVKKVDRFILVYKHEEI